MGAKEAYQQKLEAQLKIWNAEIDKWEAKSERAAAEAKIQCFESLEALKGKRHVVREKLHQMREASAEAWTGLKAGLEAAWDEFKAAYDKAAAKFKQPPTVGPINESQPRERTADDSVAHRT